VLPDALTIPSTAVQTGPDGNFAWVVAKGDVVQARPITSGPTTDGRTMIELGLTDGDQVVVSGQYKLRQRLEGDGDLADAGRRQAGVGALNGRPLSLGSVGRVKAEPRILGSGGRVLGSLATQLKIVMLVRKYE
jgi:hypothetical protein